MRPRIIFSISPVFTVIMWGHYVPLGYKLVYSVYIAIAIVTMASTHEQYIINLLSIGY